MKEINDSILLTFMSYISMVSSLFLGRDWGFFETIFLSGNTTEENGLIANLKITPIQVKLTPTQFTSITKQITIHYEPTNTQWFDFIQSTFLPGKSWCEIPRPFELDCKMLIDFSVNSRRRIVKICQLGLFFGLFQADFVIFKRHELEEVPNGGIKATRFFPIT